MCDEEIIEKFEHGGRTLKILRDDDPVDPRTWCNTATILVLSSRYDLGDNRHGLSAINFESWQEFYNYVFEQRGAIWARPVYVDRRRDYTQLVMQGWPVCQDGWDPDLYGMIYVTEDQIQTTCGKGDEYRTYEFTMKVFEDELEEYNQWLKGDVYGFQLVKHCICPECGFEHENVIDSCWGFYGKDWETNGLFESAGWKVEANGPDNTEGQKAVEA